MAIVELPLSEPIEKHGGVVAVTPDAGSDRIGTFVEVLDTDGQVSVFASDPSYSPSVQEHIESRGFAEFTVTDPIERVERVKARFKENDWLFQHLFVVHDGYQSTFEDWLEVALVDGSVPEPESGWDLDGTAVHLYDLQTSMRDAMALGKAQRSMEAVGGDTSVAKIVQRVHEEVEAPISLRGSIHGDEEYSLFRPGHIYQTMFAALVDNRHEPFDRSTHFPEINLTQS